MQITVVGLGYVGAVAAAVLSRSGHDVTGIDTDAAKIDAFSSGSCPFYEPGLSDLLEAGIASGNLRFALPSVGTTFNADTAIICVGTPTQAYGGTDLSQVYGALDWIKMHLHARTTVVMKSTVPPGTGERLMREELQDTDLQYVFNPEFLREGRALEDWLHPDRIVLGGDPRVTETLRSTLYSEIDAPALLTDITSAEMIKYAANAFLPTKISFINEMANICDRVGACIDDVARGIGMDSRIGQAFLKAGLGYGGSCFPKDTRALEFLSSVKGCSSALLSAVIEVNNRQRLLPIQALQSQFTSLKGVKVALLGLAFKPETDDVREAPALDIARLLVELGAEVRAYDPKARETARRILPDAVQIKKTAQEALHGSHAAILATEWEEFVRLPWSDIAGKMLEPRYVFDGRNALDRAILLDLGFTYRGVGRGSLG